MRRRRVIVGVLQLMCGLFPLLNALGNPRVEALHGADVVALVASRLCFGFGLGLLLTKLLFGGE
jgi:hypothetical protein